MKGDPYESHDPVFGVKESLLVTLDDLKDPILLKDHDLPPNSKILKQKFVMVSTEEATALRQKNAKEVMETESSKITFYNGLPVPAVD